MKILNNIDLFFAKVESLLLVFLLTIMIALSFSQVMLRNFFDQGILWADVVIRQLVLWVGFLGASLAVRQNRHIAIDFLPNLLPSHLKSYLKRIINFCVGLVCAFLAVAAWSFVQDERKGGSLLFLNLPVWWFQTILPISFALISFRFSIQCFQIKPTEPHLDESI